MSPRLDRDHTYPAAPRIYHLDADGAVEGARPLEADVFVKSEKRVIPTRFGFTDADMTPRLSRAELRDVPGAVREAPYRAADR